jgi:DNA-binding SARP family transcriptional activator/tetratricopeptide (TPR) repeat protein
MTTGMEFGLLGPLVVRRSGVVVPVQGKQRVLLAALLLNAGRVVPVDELTELIWGSGTPPSARVTLQNYVKRLRQALADTDRATIGTRPGGYAICVEADELDVTQFMALRESAQESAWAGSWDRAANQLRTALALWRGEPLADVPSELLVLREVPRLAEIRLQALEALIDAELRLGHHADVIADLRRLTCVYPLREHFYAMLMLTLYRSGRQGEALAAYQGARTVLIEELGAEPGAELKELHRRILAGDAALAAPEAGQLAVGGHEPVVPRQLPAPVRHFVGREVELNTLTGLLDQAGHPAPGTTMIAVIDGTAGVGKTALAVHWAHQVAQRFPDGQLYVNLRGYDPGEPMTATDALAGFLRALGVPGQAIPAEEDERAARYRSLLAGRRMLVVADNARSVEQVRPLLPGSPGCAAVVTSRDSLGGLVVRDGASRLDLDLLPAGDAVSLLRLLIGGRVDADPERAGALAAQCSRLPLALRIAAELAAGRPATPLAGLAGELADQQRRLELLEAGEDPRTAVRAVFSWSYRHLDPAAARTFRLLGLHPGPDLDGHAAAALTGTAVETAGQLVDLLARAHLIQPAGPGRFGLHDLLGAYARDLAAAEDTQGDRRAALTRLSDQYLHTAATAMDILFPAERHRRPRISTPAIPGPPLASPAAARAWLDAHRAILVALVAHTAAHGWPGHATRLAITLFRYLDTGGHYQDAVTVNTQAMPAARQAGDRAGEASVLSNLGGADWRLGRYDEAARRLRNALVIFREVGDRLGQAGALSSLGVVESCQGRHGRAADCHREALAAFRGTGDRLGQARALDSLGVVLCHQGYHEQARDYQREALNIYRELGEWHGEGSVLGNLGVVEWWQGHYDDAAERLREGLAVFCQVGDRLGQARSLSNLGVVEWWQGHYDDAAERHREAHRIFGEIGDRPGEAGALKALGEALRAAGRPPAPAS